MSDPIRNAVGTVLTNAMNFPDRVQSRLLGQDMGPLIDRVTEAVASVLAEQGEWEYGAQHSQGTNPHPSRRQAEQMVEWHRKGDERKRPEARGKAALVRRRPAGPWLPVEETDEPTPCRIGPEFMCDVHPDGCPPITDYEGTDRTNGANEDCPRAADHHLMISCGSCSYRLPDRTDGPEPSVAEAWAQIDNGLLDEWGTDRMDGSSDVR